MREDVAEGYQRNYLRVRGEYCQEHRTQNDLGELPPRARRILGGMAYAINKFGTTSACAENTHGAC